MNRSKSFSLIELLVVLTIVSLVIGLTTAYIFNFRKGSVLSLSAQEIAATFNQARSLSITKQAEYKVVFDNINNEYVVQDPTNSNIDSGHNIGSGIIIDLINFTANTVTFKPTGSANGGRIILKDNRGKYYTIKVLNVTGRIKILNYQELP